ncbi:DEAD/DEAH box helicase [uncultured Jatrophihabitans sp.]|uniref:DEAD/DEAH box helicase n=1 Tax=uncultured Jatrophihabitans sp. TaxID=1610747 RepID=UPI0035CB4D3A
MGVLAAPLSASPTPHGPRLRAWQSVALARYHEVARRRDYLVTATPGAGKTTFALALARSLVDAKIIDRVIVVAPTDHLRTQWAEAADAAGLPLDGALTNATGAVRPDLRGYVTTYAQVAAKPALHAARTGAKRTLVILDEVHHAGDGLSWGDAVATAFDLAARRLCLTGTPFRTRPDERIPFVRYAEDGEGGLRSEADYTYGYREALRDGVVRPVVFAAYTGTTRWRNSAGEVIAASLSEPSTRKLEATAWRTALNPAGKWVPHVIAAMDERISHLRESGMPDAAGLVLASDQDDARAYADIVTQVTGEAPVVILSDDPKASEKITAFTHGTQRMAVCVRMVSEGVDVPRAACLAWMTSYRTPLFFAQGVGRVVRARGNHESATVFLPAVRPLLALAAELEDERNHVIPPPAQQSDELLDVERVEPEPGETDRAELVDADASFAHILHGGRAVVAAPEDLTPEDEDYLGLPGILSPEQMASLLARRDSHARSRVAGLTPSAPEDSPPPTSSWRAGAELRREVNRLVGIYAARTGAPHGQIHAQLRRDVPGPASAAASAEVLELRRDRLMQLLGG